MTGSAQRALDHFSERNIVGVPVDGAKLAIAKLLIAKGADVMARNSGGFKCPRQTMTVR
ncbi:hypothetical protein [Mesorhizobium sp.]|uniref:hypothetical protein n=1 Tax=Mesorhizobium sp. TaxID=1871066 RepID=UPI0025C0582F|nr:hypothetical protein [Mesorhizobium sp.]